MKNVLLLSLFIVCIAATHALFSLQPVTKIGPFFTTTTTFDTFSGQQTGGDIRVYRHTSTSDTLRIGDNVYVSGKNTVDKSSTLTNYNLEAGIVVGGSATYSYASGVGGAYNDSSTVGSIAVAGAGYVAVLRSGRSWVQCDSMGAGIPAGRLINASIYTAGKVALKLAVPDTFDRILGRMVDSGGPSNKCLAEISVH